jgi:GR25 family glycosyltransferase involved in LPS biosynthesis
MSSYPIYCINLKHRTDRKLHTLNQFTKLNIPEHKVIYLPFSKNRNGGVYGCFDSHMKVWNDFLIMYPKEKYCLILEDDFVINNKSKTMLAKAAKFIDKNYHDIDVLMLHNLAIKVNNSINDEFFSNGYGFLSHAYFITRHYIESIIHKNKKLPKPNGRHFDFEMSVNKFDKDNVLYTEKIFYTNQNCMKQLNDKSDNYINIFDELFRQDINKPIKHVVKLSSLAKNNNILNDDGVKRVAYFISYLIH